MTKRVSVECRCAQFIVTSYTEVTWGMWYMNGHFEFIPLDAGPVALGQAVLDALDAANQVVPPDVKPPIAPVLRALRLRSYGQYMRGARSVGVEIDDDGVVRLTPRRNDGPKAGFTPLTDRASVLDDRSPEAMTIAVKEAIEAAE